MPTFDRVQRRILGVLFEKKTTTPDLYPLTIAALLAGANQKSNRDPEMELAQWELEGALRSLLIDGWVREVQKAGGRSVRYEERFQDRLGLDKPKAAIVTELLLRGPSTLNEMHTRAQRMAAVGAREELQVRLDELAEAGLVELLPKQPGQREPRWSHRLSPADESPEAHRLDEAEHPAIGTARQPLSERIELLESEVAALREALRATRRALGLPEEGERSS
jgi:hypothetical protein